MVAGVSLSPATAKSIDKLVASAKKRIAKARNKTLAAFHIQNAITQELESLAIEWTDSDKPDVRPVLAQLALLRAFRAMLRTLPTKRKRR